jgi:hypothetical protein
MYRLPALPAGSGAGKDDTPIFEIAIAGVLAAVFAEGPYGALSAMIGVTLLVILHGYDEEENPRFLKRVAFAAVWGFCATLTLAVIAEYYVFGPPASGTVSAVPTEAIFAIWAVLSLLADPARWLVRKLGG